MHLHANKKGKENYNRHTLAKKTLAAAIKSSVFPPVHDPIYTLSIFTLLHSLAKARLSGECGCVEWFKHIPLHQELDKVF